MVRKNEPQRHRGHDSVAGGSLQHLSWHRGLREGEVFWLGPKNNNILQFYYSILQKALKYSVYKLPNISNNCASLSSEIPNACAFSSLEPASSPTTK